MTTPIEPFSEHPEDQKALANKTPSDSPNRATTSTRCPEKSGTQGASADPVMMSDHEVLCTLVKSLEQGNRRWQIIVFPALFAFVLLSVYGFYLIYNLVEDVDKMATSVYLNMGFMSERMGQISQNLDALTGSVRDISVNLDDLTGTVTTMNATVVTISGQMSTMPPMLETMRDVNLRLVSMDDSMKSLDTGVGAMTASIQSINGQMAGITAATHHIGGNMSGLHQSIGRPMNFMNRIMPW